MEAAGTGPWDGDRAQPIPVPDAKTSSGGNTVPPPPISLQEPGRFRGCFSRTSVKSASGGNCHRPNALAPEVARHQSVHDRARFAFDSRRLHHPSLSLGLLSAPLLAGGLRPAASPNRLDSRRLHHPSLSLVCCRRRCWRVGTRIGLGELVIRRSSGVHRRRSSGRRQRVKEP